VVEAGLGYLPFTEHTVLTPTGHQYVGVDFAKKLCGVSIIRSGESMENALRACCKGIKIGKILVHRCGLRLPRTHRYTCTLLFENAVLLPHPQNPA
jgi:uridine kinase